MRRPEHKKFCGASDDWEPMRLWKILQSNKVLVPILLTAYIHRFDLLDKPTLEQPFFGRVHIGIEPEDLMDFFKIYMDPSTDASAMRGMVQINAISRVKFPTGVHELDEGFLSSWKAAQTRPYMQSYPTASYGVIWIDLPGLKNRHLSIVAIPVEAFDIARSTRPFTTVSVYEGIQERPLSVESCLQYV
jgi:hypothetical protein